MEKKEELAVFSIHCFILNRNSIFVCQLASCCMDLLAVEKHSLPIVLLENAISMSSTSKYLTCSLFIVQSTVLFSKYFGETERNIRQLFSIARSACPCLIILDEIDILASKRSYENSTNELNDRIVGTLLNELDGIDVCFFFLSDSLDEFCDCDWMYQSISFSG